MFKKAANILKSKRAMTLIEVIVASAVSSIVLIATLTFLIPTGDNMNKTKNIADARSLSEMMFDAVRSKAEYAKSVEFKTGTPAPADWADPNTYVIYVEPAADPTDPNDFDTLMCNGAPLVATGFYGRIRCDIDFAPSDNGQALDINILAKVFPRNTTIISVKKSIGFSNRISVTGVATIDYIVIEVATPPTP